MDWVRIVLIEDGREEGKGVYIVISGFGGGIENEIENGKAKVTYVL